ncbi:hypothetical protein M404DRAFT_169253 [Pisolithus tinctorius Marx 270]|uniref:Uncharacterized protein n=1 Tax=Pisolithus tinctorius Marx 270 TaxID=870435 RepID=A0A0C3J8N4_PISTI|nr:hypothetical protein M404DRAFT_169253 [Pisolithus tinctorius Marx 270]
MITRRVLRELLQRPLGPYHDKDVLSEECRLSGQSKLVLYSFVLEHDGRVIGLDESETPLEGRREDHRRFRFRGTLKIGDPDWLSDWGVKLVEAELDLRWSERAMREGERRGPPLTLKELFGNKLLKCSGSALRDGDDECELLLRIQGERGLPAVFMRASRVKDELLWTSKDQLRQYEVHTMDVATYSFSENFLWRYRLLDLMEKIVERYPYVPIEARHPEWFARKYIRDFAYPEKDKHRRIIYDSSDSDISDTDERRVRTPRQLLHVHKSEILGLFAAHAEWLLTSEAARRNNVLDLKVWYIFWKQAKKERREAARNGVIWGWPVGQEPRAEDPISSTSGEEDDEDSIVERNPVIGKPTPLVQRKLEIARKKRLNGRRRIESSASESESDVQGHAYASDFSGDSESPWEPDESPAADKEVLRLVPWQLTIPPDPPDATGRWQCPLPTCQYKIDLRRLTEENRRDVDDAIIRYIMRKEWQNVYMDDTVIRGFLRMVRNHNDGHFTEVGVKVVREGNRVGFLSALGCVTHTWIGTTRTNQTPPGRCGTSLLARTPSSQGLSAWGINSNYVSCDRVDGTLCNCTDVF